MPEERPVLVATEADDITADMVITELNQRDVPVVRFNPADIGENLTVSTRFGTCPAQVVGQVRTPSRTADVTQVRSVYWRRPEWPTFPHLSADDSRFAAAQVRYGLGGTLYALGGPLWVDHPLRVAAADYKPAQLVLAPQLGFTIPPTLVTNDPDEAREFVQTQRQAISKTLRWTPYTREGLPVTGWAAPVTPEEIDEVTGDGPRASHLNPDAPRAIQRWNGHLWEPHGFAANLAEARRILFPHTGAASTREATPKLGPGTGRHRKPPTSS